MSGRRNDYAELVCKYQCKVRGYCLGMLKDASSADDAAQEVFVKAYQALVSFKGKSSFSTWLYRIAANHCLDVLRKAKRRPESLEALLEKDGDKVESLFAVEPAVSDSGSADRVTALLACLSEKSREILILREMQELSYQEIAEVLGCSLDAVKARLKRARQELESGMRHLLQFKDV